MINTNKTQFVDFSLYNSEIRGMKSQLDLARYLPDLQLTSSSDNSITKDFNEFAGNVCGAVSWFVNAIVSEEEVDAKSEKTAQIKNNLTELAKAAADLQIDQGLIEAKISEIQAEMKGKADDSYYQEQGSLMTLKAELQYLNNHKELLANVKEQAQALNQLEELSNGSPQIDLTSFEEKIAVAAKLIREVEKTIEEIEKVSENESQSPIAAVAGFIANAADTVQGDLAEFGQLTAQDISSAAQELKESLDITKDLPKLDKESIEEFILSKVKEYPAGIKIIANILAVSIGTYVAGPAGGVAAKSAVDKILNEILPQDATDESTAGKVAAGILEAVGTYVVGGRTAAAVSGATTVIKKAAPDSVQTAVEMASTAYVANKTGFSLTTGLGLAFGAHLLLKNLSVLKSIKNDLGHAWKICKESPLQFPRLSILFVLKQGKQQFCGTASAIREGKKLEAITRIAALALGALAVICNIYTLPLNIALFYIVNKVYEPQEEKPTAAVEALPAAI